MEEWLGRQLQMLCIYLFIYVFIYFFVCHGNRKGL